MLVLERGGCREERWYNYTPVPFSSPKGDKEATRELLELYRTAVRRHLLSDVPVGRLLSGGVDSGVLLALIGFCWAFDVPFNKPRWSPSYLLYVSGVGGVVLAAIYAIVDIHKIRAWAYPAIVMGSNAIAVYWLSIMAKLLLLETPRISDSHLIAQTFFKYATPAFITVTLGIVLMRFARWGAGEIGPAAYILLALALVPAAAMWTRFAVHPLDHSDAATVAAPINIILSTLKTHLGPSAGGWIFTLTFIAFWWLVLDRMYRKGILWKI